MQAAVAVLKDLRKTRVLDITLRHKDVPPSHAEWLNLNRVDCTGFRLVVTGHSLGAGVASTLAVLLRSE